MRYYRIFIIMSKYYLSLFFVRKGNMNNKEIATALFEQIRHLDSYRKTMVVNILAQKVNKVKMEENEAITRATYRVMTRLIDRLRKEEDNRWESV